MALDDVTEALDMVNGAMLEGDRKYGKRTWADSPKIADPTERVWDHLEAVKRHADRHFMGELIDKDSGLAALAHVAARSLIALQTAINTNLLPASTPVVLCGDRCPEIFGITCALPVQHQGAHSSKTGPDIHW